MSIREGDTDFCPWCGIHVRFLPGHLFRHARGWNKETTLRLANELVDEHIEINVCSCPSCNKLVLVLWNASEEGRLIVPRHQVPRPMHADVPRYIADDVGEAYSILQDSPKASAALARRALQALLVVQGADKSKDLIDQIEQLEPQFPSYLHGSVDCVRKLGNISAHPKKSRSTGEIVDVEPGEAEFVLALILELLDHYYTKPAQVKERAAQIAEKYKDAKS